ncbi:hypothetical protein Tco_0795587 [Tanacetum coccineum]
MASNEENKFALRYRLLVHHVVERGLRFLEDSIHRCFEDRGDMFNCRGEGHVARLVIPRLLWNALAPYDQLRAQLQTNMFQAIMRMHMTFNVDEAQCCCRFHGQLRHPLRGGLHPGRTLDLRCETVIDDVLRIRIISIVLTPKPKMFQLRYDELSKANTHSRTAYTEKLSAFTAENTKLKAQVTGTIKEPPRTSNRPTQKPPVQQNKKPNVSVNLSTRTKPATESRNPMPKSHTWNHRILPSKSVNARRATDHNRRLNVVDHNQFVIRSLKSVNTKTPQAKHSVNHTKKWKPTDDYLRLYDNCPLTRIMEPIVEPLELTTSVRSSSKVTMISRFTDCKLSDRKAGSKGISVILWNAEERDVVPPGNIYTCVSLRAIWFSEERQHEGYGYLSFLYCNIDPHGIRANDDSKYPMQDMLISLLTYLKKSRKFTYKASAQSLKINVFFKY